jgi:excisionase family DNA binding protein
MFEQEQLLNLKEVSALLKINTEVLRRWLRSGKLAGLKVGSDWRVKYSDLEPLLSSSNDNAKIVSKKSLNPLKKMSTACPKWLEYSGLPRLLNDKHGPETWPIFKKLLELDFDAGRPSDRLVKYNSDIIAEVTGYDVDFVNNIMQLLAKDGYITLSKNGELDYFSIVSPIKTPKLILDIDYANGGINGAPSPALSNPCLRRYLES